MVERKPIVGGVCVNVGTIPSKTMREAILVGGQLGCDLGDNVR